ncbi:MAG TPA: hypothetical protein VNZ26_20655 [Vicinamibacterales bacterium]|jgi:hypothetical protein|nr:hypothetical protein [Vicinamibacterales bacterium]
MNVRLSLTILFLGACAAAPPAPQPVRGHEEASNALVSAESDGIADGPHESAAVTDAAVQAVSPSPEDAGVEFSGVRPVWKVERIANAVDREAVDDAARAAANVIGTPLFRQQLQAIGDLDPQVNVPPTTGDVVANLYLGLDGTGRQFPTSYITSPKKCAGLFGIGGSTAITGVSGATKAATTTLHSCTTAHARAQGTSIGEFACAVNTLAHEWTHAIPLPENPNGSLYQDARHKNSGMGLVSYTVGAIAQCVYLEMQGFRVKEKFGECLDAVGTTRFDPNTCNDTWAEKIFGKR